MSTPTPTWKQNLCNTLTGLSQGVNGNHVCTQFNFTQCSGQDLVQLLNATNNKNLQQNKCYQQLLKKL